MSTYKEILEFKLKKVLESDMEEFNMNSDIRSLKEMLNVIEEKGIEIVESIEDSYQRINEYKLEIFLMFINHLKEVIDFKFNQNSNEICIKFIPSTDFGIIVHTIEEEFDTRKSESIDEFIIYYDMIVDKVIPTSDSGLLKITIIWV